MPYRCTYCGKPHCGEHRLPEAHLCPEVGKAAAARLHRELTGDPGVEVRGVGGRRAGSPGLSRSLGRHEGRITFYFLGAIVGVFILEFLVLGSGGIDAFRRWFVLDATWPSKPWTLVSSIFAHDPSGLNHILFNGIALFFFGPLLERRIGSRRFLWLFLSGGALAGLAQVLLYSTILQSEQGVVGASGALMAVLGALTVLGPRLTVLIFFVIPAPLWALTIGYALIDIFGLMAATGGIAHMAHLAGLALGLVVGYRLRDQGFKFPGQAGHVTRAAPRW